MKKLTRNRLILLLFLPLLAVPFLFPFKERSEFRKEKQNYEQQMSVVPPPVDKIDIVSDDSDLQAVNNDVPIENTASTQKSTAKLDFPPQPLAAPYPTNWSELISWVGTPSRYGGSLDELARLHVRFDSVPGPMSSRVMRLNGSPNNLYPFLQDLQLDYGTLHDMHQDDEQGELRYRPLSSEAIRLINQYVERHRKSLTRLHEYVDINGIFVDPIFGAQDFGEATRQELDGKLRIDTDNIGRALFLESIYFAEKEDLDASITNILLLFRLTEHMMATWYCYDAGPYYQNSRFGFTVFEYLVNRYDLSKAQIHRVMDWANMMETRFDNRPKFAGSQIQVQQSHVRGYAGFAKPGKAKNLTPSSSVTDELVYMFKETRRKYEIKESTMKYNHQRFLMSGECYFLQTRVMSWYARAMASCEASNIFEAADIMPIESGILDAKTWRKATTISEKYRWRAHQAFPFVHRIFDIKYTVINQLRLLRAACVAKLHLLEFGEYPTTIEEAADALNVQAPLDIMSGLPPKVLRKEDRILLIGAHTGMGFASQEYVEAIKKPDWERGKKFIFFLDD